MRKFHYAASNKQIPTYIFTYIHTSILICTHVKKKKKKNQWYIDVSHETFTYVNSQKKKIKEQKTQTLFINSHTQLYL